MPVAGGWYDQHPQLVDEWSVLFELEQARESREAEQHKREMDRMKHKRR